MEDHGLFILLMMVGVLFAGIYIGWWVAGLKGDSETVIIHGPGFERKVCDVELYQSKGKWVKSARNRHTGTQEIIITGKSPEDADNGFVEYLEKYCVYQYFGRQ